MRTILPLLFLSALASSAPASETTTGSVRGFIFDEAGRPEPYAHVVVVGTNQYGTQTDESGRFQLDRIPTGRQFFRILSLGMNEATFDVTIVSGDTTTIRPIYLRPFGLTEAQAAAESIGVDVPWGARALTCQVRPASELLRVGDKPAFKVSITNHGKGALELVSSVDGSDRGRYPLAKIKIDGPEGGLSHKWIAFCGNLNQLRLEDFVELGPGESFDPFASGWLPVICNETFLKPGRYTVTFTYSTHQPDVRRWLGDGGGSLRADLSKRFRAVPMVELTATADFVVTE